MSTSSCRSARLISHSCSSGVPAMTAQPSASSTDVPCASSMTWRATHVGACTPFVIDVIGTSSLSKPGHSPANMPRETSPWSRLDAVRALGHPQAHDGHVEHGRVAALVRLGTEREHALDGHARRGVVAAEVLGDEVDGEPVDAGGHGVWVVKTVPARLTSRASSNVIAGLVATSSRMRSRPRNPACPSFVWYTSAPGAPMRQ